jgi:hypothetical protein
MARLVLAGLAALVIVAIPTAETAKAYQYVEDVETYEYASDGYNVRTSTSIEYAYASANAEDQGGGAGACSCVVSTHTWAENDSAVADSSADATWLIDWTWDGPPGEAPGGTLSGDHWGCGRADAWGHNDITDPQTQSGYSLGDAWSQTWATGTAGLLAAATIRALGYVYDYDWGTTQTGANAEPWEDLWTDPNPEAGYGWYDVYILWDLDTADDATIPSGTSYVYFAGGANCDNLSAAAAGGGAEADAKTLAVATVSVWADFDWP